MTDVGALKRALDDQLARIAVIGQGYVGLPVAMRAAKSASASSATTSPTGADRAAPAGTVLRRGRLRRTARSGAGPDGYAPTSDPPTSPASTSPSSPCRRRCATAPPTSRTSRPRRRDPRPAAAPGRARRPRVDDVSRHHRGAAAPDPRARSGLHAGVDFFLGYSPERIDPGNPQWTLVEHAQGRVRHRCRVARRGRGVLRHARRQGRAGRRAPARPSW